MIKICIFCLKKYNAKQINSRFCSKKCNRKKYVKDNIEKIKIIDQTSYLKNRNKRILKSSTYYINNKSKVKKYKKEYNKINKEKIKYQQKCWNNKNSESNDYKAKNAAQTAKYRAQKLKATPKWLTENHFKEIRETYNDCQDLQWLSEERLEVDHIIPLQGKTVSGLHVPWNLQILLRSVNIRKSNNIVEEK